MNRIKGHPEEVLYRGERDQDDELGECRVTVEPSGALLPRRLDLRKHSPTGFEWGYGGSGPAQLALAILADFLGDDAAALRRYQDFKFAVIARLERESDWVLTRAQLEPWTRDPGGSVKPRIEDVDDEYSGPKRNPHAEESRLSDAQREGESHAWVQRVVRGAKAFWGFLTFQGKGRP